MPVFWCLKYHIKFWIATQPELLSFLTEQAQLKLPPVPIFNHKWIVNHADCLAEAMDHCTMVN